MTARRAPKRTDRVSQTAEHPYRDLRLELQVKNNVLWQAIFSRYRSVAALCYEHKELTNKESIIGDLLRFKKSPLKKKSLRPGTVITTTDYRGVCLALEKILGILAEDLFPAHLYQHLVGTETIRVIEVSSFSALPSAVRREIRSLPAPAEESPEALLLKAEIRERVRAVVDTLSRRERKVVEHYFGLRDGSEYSIREIAELMNTTPKNVHAILDRARIKLQHPSRSRRLREFLTRPTL